MKFDFLIVGGGVIGLCIALELKRRHPSAAIGVIEKESSCGLHASGRNSGVLHAGFYYAADSLKATFTRDGNRQMTRFCEENGLKIKKCGKLVVAQTEQDLPWLDELLNRAKNNDVELLEVTEGEARDIEPRVKTLQRALYSPSTSSIDPVAVMKALTAKAKALGVLIHTNTKYIQAKNNVIITNRGQFETNCLINAAGLYADKIAMDFGFSQNYRILPFKGVYLYANENAAPLKTNVYPVPNLNNPFLGVHFTTTVAGKTKIGPTAIPAFWREQYGSFENFDIHETADIVMRQAGLLAFSNFDFKRLAIEELQKYSRKKLVSLASSLAEDINAHDYTHWGPAGIRAQLLDIKNRKLEMDFVIEGDDRSIHVLNAVSPAFTCALPFASHVCDRLRA